VEGWTTPHCVCPLAGLSIFVIWALSEPWTTHRNS
jgi:hypothetical protein